jgi:hypothetical protein
MSGFYQIEVGAPVHDQSLLLGSPGKAAQLQLPIREHRAQLSELIQTDESPARGLMDAARMPTAGVHGDCLWAKAAAFAPPPAVNKTSKRSQDQIKQSTR